jgi:glycosyltransferase involved in cell wall biosynthesis
LEGLAAGLPIVTTDPGGIPDMITDRRTGHLVAVNDHEAAAARILELVGNPAEVLRLSRAGKEEVRRYTWEAVAPLWKDLYFRVAGLVDRQNTQEALTMLVGLNETRVTP